MNLDHTEEEVGFALIDYTNETNNIYMNDDANVFHKYCAPFL